MKTDEQIIADERERKELVVDIKRLLLSSSISKLDVLSQKQIVDLKATAAKAQKLVNSHRPKLDELRSTRSVLQIYMRKENE